MKRDAQAVNRSLTRPTDKPRGLVPAGTIRRNIVWSLASTAIYGGCQLGYLVAAARLGDAATVGRFALAFAVTTPIILLANCALRTIQAGDATERFRFSDYLVFRLSTLCAAAIAIVAVAFAYDPATRATLLWIGAAKIAESLSDVLHGDFQRRERLDLIGQSAILRGVISLAIWCAALVVFRDTATAAATIALTWVVVLFVYDLLAFIQLEPATWRQRLRPIWNWEQQRKLLSETAPMGITVMTGALIANMPRYFLEHWYGPAELGIFAALAGVASVGNMAATAVAHAVFPRLAQAFARNDRPGFRKLTLQLLTGGAVTGLVIALIGALFGRPLLRASFGAEYANFSHVFLILLFSIAFSIVICVLDHVFYAARWFRVQVPINIAVLVAMGVMCLLMIGPASNGSGGILGAAWVTCLVAAAQCAIRLPIVWRLLFPAIETKGS
jgi:O-antigen/teichoic acid export membrane protein